MAFLTSISVDLLNNTVGLTSIVNEYPVETITYDKASNRVTFDARPEILLNFTEFLDFCNQVNILQTAIIFNFSANVNLTKPFKKIVSSESHTDGNWNLTVTGDSDEPIVQYEATKSSLKFLMIERSLSKTLDFPEWIYFLQSFNHYRLSIKGF